VTGLSRRARFARSQWQPPTAEGITKMKKRLMGFAVAAALVAAHTLPSHAEDATPTPPAGGATTPSATPSEPPVSVPRPSILPKTVEPSKPVVTEKPTTAEKPVATDKPVVTDDDTARRHRRYARRHWRYAYWQPFPVYWPHLSRSHFYWSRISWFGF
jgi:hypothetical protein